MADIVVGGQGQKSKWKWIAIVIVGLVLAVSLGAAVRWLQNRQYQKEQQLTEAIDKAQGASVDGDYDQAHSELSKQLEQPGLSSDQRYAVIYQQGITYENQGQYAKAIAAYREAGKIQQTSAVYEAIARTAQAAGNSQLAIESYKKALSLLNPNQPNYNSQKSFYENSIKALGGEL